MWRASKRAIVIACAGWCVSTLTVFAETCPIIFNDDGGWCWFQDERAIIHNGKLIIGSVASGTHDAARKGNIEAVTFDLSTRCIQRTVLHNRLECDDHDSPAFLALRNGQVLATYSKHGSDDQIYFRKSQDRRASQWGPECVVVPSLRSRVTYSNLFLLRDENDGAGRLFNFYRGYDDSFKPSWMTSDDGGTTWSARGLWIDNPVEQRHRPYVKYASDNQTTLHFVFTEGHPRDFDNSIYHAYYRNGSFYDSSDREIKKLSDGPISPTEATRVFSGDENNVAWTADLHLDRQGRPVIVYSVQKDDAGLGRAHPKLGQDHRYRYARWDGFRWHDHEVAYAGTRLYPGEDDYTGGICLNPDNLNEVYLSSDVNIFDGRSRNSTGHYEIYKGITNDFGCTWMWTAVTENSTVDNIRPIVPKWNQCNTALLWLRGNYTSYTEFELQIVGVLQESP